jgi:Asp/Glu/hydantoin racemase
MKLWHQSMTVLDRLPAYKARIAAHARKVLRPDTELVLHGLAPDTYPSDYPGDDISYGALFAMHSLQWMGYAWKAQQTGFDGFAMCTMADPMLREARSIVDIPVIGCAETSFHAAARNNRRFGMLLFIDRMEAFYEEKIHAYGLAGHFVGAQPVGFKFSDVLEGFDRPGPLIDRFRVAARRLIDAGADVVIPAEVPMNLLLASEGISAIDGAAVMDSLALTLTTAEAAVDQHKAPNREGWHNAAPQRERVEQVLRYYGLSKFMD